MIQQLLMRFATALSRRRAYAPTHPMVQAAESELMEAVTAAMAGCATLSIGVAHHELLINGAPHTTRGGYARDLAARLHRRGVGSITLEQTLSLQQLRDALAWIAVDGSGAADIPPQHGGVYITRIAYDHLVLDDAIRDAETAVASLWRTLAELAEFGTDAPVGSTAHEAASDASEARTSRFADSTGTDATGYDTDAILTALRGSLHQPTIARRTAAAMLELTAARRTAGAILDFTDHGMHATGEVRDLIGQQLLSVLDRLGTSSFAPILRSLNDRALEERFTTQVIEVLPVQSAVAWLETAAQASEQQLSHQMVRLMSKLSTLASTRRDDAMEATFRDAARDLVHGWSLPDPNPDHHVELLDRIANFERHLAAPLAGGSAQSANSVVESSRLVQMALELSFGGEDTAAAVEALVAAGMGKALMGWIAKAGPTPTARWLHGVATSERTVRQLLLTEPVDRLQARALLDELGPNSAGTLLDVLAESQTRGTRLLVRQRLAEFGDGITATLLARLDNAPWYLVRNILTLLHEIAVATPSMTQRQETIQALQTHEQVQVRVEALRLLLIADAETRDAALQRALRDDNERVVVVALQALTDACEAGSRLPTHVVTQLMALVDDGSQSDPVRARAVRTLAFTRTEPVRDWLLSLISRRTKILRRLTLVEPTQTAVSALQVLMRTYPADPRVAPTLTLARRSGQDPRWHVRDAGHSAEHAT